MIAQQNRFHGYGSLNFVYRKGHSIRSGSLTLRYVSSRNNDFKLAVVVSKKVSKSAVVRNRIRRRIYEAVRLQKTATWPYDMVITVFEERLATMPASELHAEVQKLLKKSNIT